LAHKVAYPPLTPTPLITFTFTFNARFSKARTEFSKQIRRIQGSRQASIKRPSGDVGLTHKQAQSQWQDALYCYEEAVSEMTDVHEALHKHFEDMQPPKKKPKTDGDFEEPPHRFAHGHQGW
jgi:hypothetical protein